MNKYLEPPPHWTEISDGQIAAFAEFLRSNYGPGTVNELSCLQQWLERVSSSLQFCMNTRQALIEDFACGLVHLVETKEIALAGQAALLLVRLNQHTHDVLNWVIQCFDEPSVVLSRRPCRFPVYRGELVDVSDVTMQHQLTIALQSEAVAVADELVEQKRVSHIERSRLVAALRRAGVIDSESDVG